MSNDKVEVETNPSVEPPDFSVRVKQGFVLQNRAPTLPPLPSQQEIQDTDQLERNKGDRNTKEKNRGRNKKRPRDARIDSAAKFCLSVLRGEDCLFGDTCRFPHDLKGFMAARPEDIKEVGLCPIFQSTGKCPFGALCRFGSCHTNMATGRNIVELKNPPPKEITNTLSKDTQTKLRKKTYEFKCKRHYEKSSKNSTVTKEDGDVNNDSKSENLPVEKNVSDGTEQSSNDALVDKENNTSGSAETSRDVLTSEIELNTRLFNGTEKIILPETSYEPLPTKTRKIIDFSNKVYVAPLTTVGNLPFRRIMKRFGADITCGEMAVAQNILEGKAQEWALLKRHPEEDIFGVQIAAGFPDMFTRTAELIENETTVDFVDLNLGCPLDLVCDKGAGSALMLRDKKFKECLEGITKTLSCAVTVKMRIGWDEKKPFAHNLVPKIQTWQFPGISAVMIHGRSRLQRYSKPADWDYIDTVAQSIDQSLDYKIPVIGNGDIMSYKDYEDKVLARKDLSTCAMLARGALIKPWLPTEIKERRQWDISASERLDILKDFVRFGLENWGTDQQGVNNCRRFLLEWLSFLHRYIPIGIIEEGYPQQMNQRPPAFLCGRNDLETLFLSNQSCDWVKISEMLLGPVPDGFKFEPKHKANSHSSPQREEG